MGREKKLRSEWETALQAENRVFSANVNLLMSAIGIKSTRPMAELFQGDLEHNVISKILNPKDGYHPDRRTVFALEQFFGLGPGALYTPLTPEEAESIANSDFIREAKQAVRKQKEEASFQHKPGC